MLFRSQAVHKLVFPLMAALGYRPIVGRYEHSFDTGRAKLDTEYGFTCLYFGFYVKLHNDRPLLVKHVVHVIVAELFLELLYGGVLVDTHHLYAGHLCIVFPVFGSQCIGEA